MSSLALEISGFLGSVWFMNVAPRKAIGFFSVESAGTIPVNLVNNALNIYIELVSKSAENAFLFNLVQLTRRFGRKYWVLQPIPVFLIPEKSVGIVL